MYAWSHILSGLVSCMIVFANSSKWCILNGPIKSKYMVLICKLDSKYMVLVGTDPKVYGPKF